MKEISRYDGRMVDRGGGVCNSCCSVSARLKDFPFFADLYLGFRVVMEERRNVGKGKR